MDPVTLDKLHKTELEILDVIIKICKDNDLTYYLAGGSVLGAIRHKGIIPWDDDIDIMMYREDLLKFEQICKEQLPKGYFYQSSNTDPHYHHIFSKIRKNGTIFIEKGNEESQQHNGVFVDIFPLDCAKKERGIQRYQAIVSNKIEKILKVQDGLLNGNIKDKILLHILNRDTLKRIRQKVLSFYNTDKNKYYVNFGSQYGVIKQTMPKSLYYPPVEALFEGRMCNIPNDYDAFLKRLYGESYMELPPLEKRVTHNPIKILLD